MDDRKKKDLSVYMNAYSFIEFSSGLSIINLSRTVALMRLVHKNFYEKFKLSEPKFFVLLLLNEAEEGIPLIEIGNIMLVSRANITTLIERMVRDGFVEKRKNSDDKRSTKAYITEAGRKLFYEVADIHKEFSHRLVNALDEEEKESLNKLLGKVQLGIIEDFANEY